MSSLIWTPYHDQYYLVAFTKWADHNKNYGNYHNNDNNNKYSNLSFNARKISRKDKIDNRLETFLTIRLWFIDNKTILWQSNCQILYEHCEIIILETWDSPDTINKKK